MADMENPAGLRGGASEIDHAERLIFSDHKLERAPAQALRAELIGDTCTAAGITARGSAPTLALCRELIAAGLDPDRALEVYRGAVLALRVRSIGEGARLTVKTAGNGCPIFALLEGAAAPPVRQTEGEAA